MKKTFFCSLLVATAICGSANATSLFEALSQAYDGNPTLQAQRAYLRSVDENVAIAKSGYRPNVYLQGSYADAKLNSNIPSLGNDTKQKVYSANVSQQLFSGLQTVNSVSSADSLVRSEQDNFYTVEQGVFLDASTAYLDVVQNTAIVNLQKNNEKLLKKRLDETVQRFNVGEVTRTDVSQARARYSRAQADRINSEGVLEASKATYAQLIGAAPSDLKEPAGTIDTFLPKTFGEALEYAKAHNYIISQAKNYLDSKEYDIKSNTGALLPQVSLDGIASKTRGDIDTQPNKSETDNLEWSINMKVPLYNSGETRAKVRQSKYQKWQAQELVQEAERQVTSGVTSAWEYMTSNKAMIVSIKEQVKANEVALDGVQKEEALGNRTIIDVLDAYQELLNSNVEEVKARRNYYVSSFSLLQSMGRLTAKDLNLNVELYNPKKYYKETRDKWLSLSIDK